jgi:hypothetical protein
MPKNGFEDLFVKILIELNLFDDLSEPYSRARPRVDHMKNKEINRPRAWNGKGLAGEWLVTIKIDGVRAIWHDGRGWLSRANKPLYNIPTWQPGGPRDCEVFAGTYVRPRSDRSTASL